MYIVSAPLHKTHKASSNRSLEHHFFLYSQLIYLYCISSQYRHTYYPIWGDDDYVRAKQYHIVPHDTCIRHACIISTFQNTEINNVPKFQWKPRWLFSILLESTGETRNCVQTAAVTRASRYIGSITLKIDCIYCGSIALHQYHIHRHWQLQNKSHKTRAEARIELTTSRTRSGNHTTRPHNRRSNDRIRIGVCRWERNSCCLRSVWLGLVAGMFSSRGFRTSSPSNGL